MYPLSKNLFLSQLQVLDGALQPVPGQPHDVICHGVHGGVADVLEVEQVAEETENLEIFRVKFF